MIVERTEWTPSGPRIHTDDGLVEWNQDEQFHWDVSEMVAPHSTPLYVFEPRPLQSIQSDLDQATDSQTTRRLEQELQLCDRPHVVYVAFYGTLQKVGMTQEARLEQRLAEQGADAGCVIARTPDRASSRDAENAASFQFKIPQWRAHKQVFPQWTRPVPWDRIRGRAADLATRLSPHFNVEPLVELPAAPLPLLDGIPHRSRTEGTHKGTVVGAKGNYLVYRAAPDPRRLDIGGGPLVALKRTELEGRSLTVN